MTEFIADLKLNKNTYITKCINYIKDSHSTRTTNLEKCYRDLSFIFDALVNGLEHNIEDYATDIGSMFWHKGYRQLENRQVEYKVYNFLEKLIVADHPLIKADVNKFISTLTKTIENGAKFKIGNTCNEELATQLNTVAINRHNWKPLTGNRPTPLHVETILNAAAGVTPALSNEYNYRVDEVPDQLKKPLYKSIVQWSTAAADSGNERYARDHNEQLMAPLVLCYSLRYNRNNPNYHQFCGDMTDRDPNLFNIGMCIWHTVLIAEFLGYKTSLCQVTQWKRDTAKDLLGLMSEEPQSTFLTEKNGSCTFMPMFFLCIGTEGATNSNTRSFKHEDIINKLRFNI